MSMEYIEMIFQRVPRTALGQVIREELRPDDTGILTSRFFDLETDRELEYPDITWDTGSFPRGTGHIFLEAVDLGIVLERALVLVCCSGEYGEITVHVEETQLMGRQEEELRALLRRLGEIQSLHGIGGFLLGYEPAEDRDMSILAFGEGGLDLFEDVRFSAPEAALLRRIGGKLFGQSFAGNT